MVRHTVFSVDDHVIEPADLFEQWLPPRTATPGRT